MNLLFVLVFNHSFSDVFLMSSRVLNLLGLLKGPVFIVFGLAHVGWIWLRLIGLPLLIFDMNKSLAMSMRPEFSDLLTY